MKQTSTWLTLYQKASEAALAAREAESSPGAAGKCVAAAQVMGGPVCVCPACKARRMSGRATGDFDTFWRHSATDNDLLSILQRVRKDLPKVRLENGTESREEILRPPASKDPDGPAFREKWNNADEFQRYLAETLPEIEYRIDGNPPEASTDWADTDRRARDFLEPLIDAPEVTQGTAGMSRRVYATEALRLLDEVRSWSAMFASALPDDDREAEQAPEHEQRWLRECFAEIAVRAFNAGVLSRAAGGKAIEGDALWGEKSRKWPSDGGAARALQTAPGTKAVLEFMAEKIAGGATKSAAAREAAKKGLGSSVDANRSIWYREREKAGSK